MKKENTEEDFRIKIASLQLSEKKRARKIFFRLDLLEIKHSGEGVKSKEWVFREKDTMSIFIIFRHCVSLAFFLQLTLHSPLWDFTYFVFLMCLFPVWSCLLHLWTSKRERLSPKQNYHWKVEWGREARVTRKGIFLKCVKLWSDRLALTLSSG